MGRTCLRARETNPGESHESDCIHRVWTTGRTPVERDRETYHVIDYTQEDFTQGEQGYHLIFDIAGSHPVSDYRRALHPGGILVSCAISPVALLLGPFISMFGSKKVVQLSHSPNAKDLVLLNEILKARKVVPVIDRSFPLSEITEAVRHYEEGRPQGKVAISVEHSDD